MNIISLVFHQHRKPFLAMFALTLLSGLLGIGVLVFINSYLLQSGETTVQGVMWQFAALLVLYLAAATFAQIRLSKLGHQFVFELRTQLLKRIMDSHDAQIQLTGKPRLLASLSNDIRSISMAFARLPELVQGVLFTFGCSAYLIWLSPKLFIVTALILAVMILGSHYVVKRVYTSFKAMRGFEDKLYAHYETSLDGHKELKLNRYRAERFYNEDFTAAAAQNRHYAIRADSYHAFAVNWGNTLMLAAVGIIFYLSIYHHWASLADAATITMTVLFMRSPLSQAIGAFPMLMNSQVALNALNDLGLTDYQSSFHGNETLPQNWQSIRLENITYAHPMQGGHHFALQPVNLTLKRGETVFLIGANGSGKSTLSMGTDLPSSELLGERANHALAHVAQVQARWQWLLDNLDAPLADYKAHYGSAVHAAPEARDEESCFTAFRDFRLRVSVKSDIMKPLSEIFSGKADTKITEALAKIHSRVVRGRVFVALHMHAGDGNVHTNIPVNSDDYEMLQTAHKAVDRIMAIARRLNGVISGEHGIGITKLEYLTDEEMQPFWDYKARIDPQGRFNRGKLMKGADLRHAYTPSFELLGVESLIMEQSDLGTIAESIKDCLRCGKCKPVCSTHVPRANLLYSPRNKILGVGLLTEAFLYEEQTRRGVSLRHFDELNDVGDHCTVCHRCVKPCPVNIDFGDVTVAIRNYLGKSGKRKFNPAVAAGMAFLNAKDPRTINLLHKGVIDAGFRLQNWGYQMGKKFRLGTKKQKAAPKTTVGAAPIKEQVVHFINRPLPRNVPIKTARALLGVEDNKTVPIIRNPALPEDSEAVFYFPGCGSERLFSQVGLATQAMLWHAGVQTVLPPGYLCCGYPQDAGGNATKAEEMTTENRVLFHRVANTLNYLDIKTVVVSCGTCYDQLEKYRFEEIFPGCRMIDIHEFLLEKGIKLDGVTGQQYLYHDPCHSPIKTTNPTALTGKLMGQEVLLSDRCCGESGMFAVKRPDIATQVKFRKQEEIEKNKAALPPGEPVRMLTSCPACLQGLSRYSDDNAMPADYIVVEMAKHILGEQWQNDFVKKATEGGIEKVLL